MVLGTAVDSNVLSYLVLIIMKEQGVVIGRGRACPQPLVRGEAYPQPSGEAEPALSRRASGACPRTSGEAEPALRRSGEAEPALNRRARRSLPPQTLGEVESTPRRWAIWILPPDVGRGRV